MFRAITLCNGQKLGSYRILTGVQILFIDESCINTFNNILSQGTVLVCAYLKTVSRDCLQRCRQNTMY